MLCCFVSQASRLDHQFIFEGVLPIKRHSSDKVRSADTRALRRIVTSKFFMISSKIPIYIYGWGRELIFHSGIIILRPQGQLGQDSALDFSQKILHHIPCTVMETQQSYKITTSSVKLPFDHVDDNPERGSLGPAEVICCNNFLHRGRDRNIISK